MSSFPNQRTHTHTSKGERDKRVYMRVCGSDDFCRRDMPFAFFFCLTMHNPEHHITFTQNIGNVHMTGMCTSMNNPIHIKIQMIKFRKKCGIGNNLINLRISFTDPSKKLRVPHQKETKTTFIKRHLW